MTEGVERNEREKWRVVCMPLKKEEKKKRRKGKRREGERKKRKKKNKSYRFRYGFPFFCVASPVLSKMALLPMTSSSYIFIFSGPSSLESCEPMMAFHDWRFCMGC